jgi:phage/plasmid-associated DNA primase
LTLTNCEFCVSDLHDDCLDESTCLCAVETKHNTINSNSSYRFIDITKPINPPKDNYHIEDKDYKNDDYTDIVNHIVGENDYITIRESDKVWKYDSELGIYLANGESYIKEQVESITHNCLSKTRYEVLEKIKSKTYITAQEFFENDYIVTLDGVLDSKTFEDLGHSPDFYSTKRLPFNLNYEANNYKLFNHINTIIDPRDIGILYEIIWIAITRRNPFKKLIIFKGLSNTQKSALVEIITWIIGKENVSNVKPQKFLSKNSRFDTSNFIGKRMNVATEIGNLENSEIESLKSLVGAEPQYTERKNDNTPYLFDPNKFLFIFSTNELGDVYSKINDNSLITRLQFMFFRNVITEPNGNWADELFSDDNDKQESIDTVVRLVIAYKKKQIKTKWSSIEETKEILRNQMPLEDKFFIERLVPKSGSQVTMEQLVRDYQDYTGKIVDNQRMGYILKNHNLTTSKSGNKILRDYCLKSDQIMSIFEP